MRIDIAGFGRGGRDLPHDRLIEICELADYLGFGGIWFNEFHFQPEPQAYPSTLLLASAVLARTRRLRVGTSLLVLPLYHPLLLAEMVAQLHWQSDGRFDLGIGRGTHPDTLSRLGINPSQTRIRFEEAFSILTNALYDTATITTGMSWPPSDGPVGPLLKDQPIPIYVGGSTDETIGFAARNALPLLLSLEPPEAAQCAIYRRIIADEGLKDCMPCSSLSRFMFVARTRPQAERLLKNRYAALYQRRIDAARRAGRDPRRIGPPDLHRFRETQAIVGTPDDCTMQIATLKARTNIGALRLVFNGNGAFETEEAMDEMRLFAEAAFT
ncbi:LLM class flavin-dependent oxidoreductase [Pseudorhodobacter aquimaris]|uniref:LLM class flavin-dependent oxidoreductase n=1 Tax=Pseudorhodobacter aquimaris TaxID=687412 RepID=UPI00067D0972|nr:LLM class flavin-dependent oxidoreductase [Pseudorhodobacter aquimaris]